MSNKENAPVTGLESSTNFKEDEMNIVAALMEAASYKTSKDVERTITIKRPDGTKLFSFNIRPLSQSEVVDASKKATKMIPNPAGSKLPPISGERNQSAYHNYLIYTATVERDKERVWGNHEVMNKFDILDPAEMVDIVLDGGTKSKTVTAILDISGYNDEAVMDEVEYIKN